MLLALALFLIWLVLLLPLPENHAAFQRRNLPPWRSWLPRR